MILCLVWIGIIRAELRARGSRDNYPLVKNYLCCDIHCRKQPISSGVRLILREIILLFPVVKSGPRTARSEPCLFSLPCGNFWRVLLTLEKVSRDEYLFKFKSARAALDTASRIAGLPRFTHHCLRHFFVSNAIEKGIDFKTIANWIGHKDGRLARCQNIRPFERLHLTRWPS